METNQKMRYLENYAIAKTCEVKMRRTKTKIRRKPNRIRLKARGHKMREQDDARGQAT